MFRMLGLCKSSAIYGATDGRWKTASLGRGTHGCTARPSSIIPHPSFPFIRATDGRWKTASLGRGTHGCTARPSSIIPHPSFPFMGQPTDERRPLRWEEGRTGARLVHHPSSLTLRFLLCGATDGREETASLGRGTHGCTARPSSIIPHPSFPFMWATDGREETASLGRGTCTGARLVHRPSSLTLRFLLYGQPTDDGRPLRWDEGRVRVHGSSIVHHPSPFVSFYGATDGRWKTASLGGGTCTGARLVHRPSSLTLRFLLWGNRRTRGRPLRWDEGCTGARLVHHPSSFVFLSKSSPAADAFSVSRSSTFRPRATGGGVLRM